MSHRTVAAFGDTELEAALAPFRGAIHQVPPQVSAVHVNGMRAYARVRRGESVELAARPITISSLELLGWDPASGQLKLELRCSAGTYVRALAGPRPGDVPGLRRRPGAPAAH